MTANNLKNSLVNESDTSSGVCGGCENMAEQREDASEPKKYRYTVELGVRARGVQLLELTDDEKEELLDENLDEVYLDWVDKKEYGFALEAQYLTSEVDRFSLAITDENGDIVFETEDVEEFLERDKTYDEDEEQVKGWEFKGFKDGFYLTRIQTIKGCWYTGEFELTEPFDEEKLYLVRDSQIDEELLGDYPYPLGVLYYQNGEGYDMNRDEILLDYDSDMGEQYYDTYLLKLVDTCWWQNLQESYD